MLELGYERGFKAIFVSGAVMCGWERVDSESRSLQYDQASYAGLGDDGIILVALLGALDDCALS
jgi:hypothetical protein